LEAVHFENIKGCKRLRNQQQKQAIEIGKQNAREYTCHNADALCDGIGNDELNCGVRLIARIKNWAE
jgi:hypothetical protein